MSIYKKAVSPERVAFESWYRGGHTTCPLVRTRKGYIDETTRVAWRAWQASMERRGV